VNSAASIPTRFDTVARFAVGRAVIFVDLVYAGFVSANWRWKEKFLAS
jgi:hypothetical protein